MIEVRAATAADALALATLRWEFRAGRDRAVESQQAFIDRCAEWMRDGLAGNRWRAWIAVRTGHGGGDERIVGQVWLHLIQKMPNPIGERERHAYVSNLYAQPAERGGVGTALLQKAIDWARANGVDRIILWPSPKSVTLYRRHGFTREGEVMELVC